MIEHSAPSAGLRVPLPKARLAAKLREQDLCRSTCARRAEPLPPSLIRAVQHRAGADGSGVASICCRLK